MHRFFKNHSELVSFQKVLGAGISFFTYFLSAMALLTGSVSELHATTYQGVNLTAAQIRAALSCPQDPPVTFIQNDAPTAYNLSCSSGSVTGLGACLIPQNKFTVDHYAAISSNSWNWGAACGACAALKGPNGATTVVIIDECTTCADPEHLDLGVGAYSELVGHAGCAVTTSSCNGGQCVCTSLCGGAPSGPITWTFVQCPLTGSVAVTYAGNSAGNIMYVYKSGCTNGWDPIQFIDSFFVIASVGVGTSSTGPFNNLNLDSSDTINNFWGGTGQSNPSGTLYYRLTNTEGQAVTTNGITSCSNTQNTSNANNTTYGSTGVQFQGCVVGPTSTPTKTPTIGSPTATFTNTLTTTPTATQTPISGCPYMYYNGTAPHALANGSIPYQGNATLSEATTAAYTGDTNGMKIDFNIPASAFFGEVEWNWANYGTSNNVNLANYSTLEFYVDDTTSGSLPMTLNVYLSDYPGAGTTGQTQSNPATVVLTTTGYQRIDIPLSAFASGGTSYASTTIGEIDIKWTTSAAAQTATVYVDNIAFYGTCPTSTPTPTNTPTRTSTFTPTKTATATATYTITNTPTFSATASPTNSRTNSPTSTATATVTNTLAVTNTATSTATKTPTTTPTYSPTNTVGNTATFTPSATITNTPVSSFTPTSTPTLSPSGTSTGTPTNSATRTPTSTITATLAATATKTPTATSTGSPTNTVGNTATQTPTSSATRTATLTPSATVTNTPVNSFTPTLSPSGTSTGTPTNSATRTATFTVTVTPTNSATYTVTLTPTFTPTNTLANTATPTSTPSSTPTMVTVAASQGTSPPPNSNQLSGATNVPIQQVVMTNPSSSTVNMSSLTLTATGSGNPANITSVTLFANGTAVGTATFTGTTAVFSISGTLPPSSSVTYTVKANFGSGATGTYSFSVTAAAGSNGQAVLFSGLPVAGATVTVTQPTATYTFTATATFSSTLTATATASSTPTLTLTNTRTASPTATPSNTASITPTGTPTSTRTWTPTASATATPTLTFTITLTPTLTRTRTVTPTPTTTFPTFDVFSVSTNLFRPSNGPMSIQVQYSIFPGDYRLDIFDSAGEHIRTIDSQYLIGQLSKTYQWDGKNEYGADCASGVYIFYLSEPFSRKIKRVLLVR